MSADEISESLNMAHVEAALRNKRSSFRSSQCILRRDVREVAGLSLSSCGATGQRQRTGLSC